MAKRNFVPRLQYLMNKIVILRFDKKHRIYFENKFNDETPKLYLSKYCIDYKAGIPSRITHIKDCDTHAYITIEPAKFSFPSEIQTAKAFASIAKDIKQGHFGPNGKDGYINPIVCSIGNVIEISHLKKDGKTTERFIIGMAFGTLWKILYQDYRKYVPKDINRSELLSLENFLFIWYKLHPTKAPTEEEVTKYLIKNNLLERFNNRNTYVQYNPTTKCEYVEVCNMADDTDTDIIRLAYETPCIVPPYRSDKICETLVQVACHHKMRPTEIIRWYKPVYGDLSML